MIEKRHHDASTSVLCCLDCRKDSSITPAAAAEADLDAYLASSC